MHHSNTASPNKSAHCCLPMFLQQYTPHMQQLCTTHMQYKQHMQHIEQNITFTYNAHNTLHTSYNNTLQTSYMRNTLCMYQAHLLHIGGAHVLTESSKQTSHCNTMQKLESIKSNTNLERKFQTDPCKFKTGTLM